jgi:predicted HTH domain antitoxin
MMWSADWTFTHLSKLRKQQPDLVDMAIKQLIDNSPDLAWSLVVTAYLDEEINLGKAAEMLSLHELELRDRFIALGIPLRVGPANKSEALAEAQALTSWFSAEDTTSNP